MKRAPLLIVALALSGCTPAYVHPLLPADHPANPDATQASFVTPPNVLTANTVDTMEGMNHEGMEGMADMEGMNHEGMADADPMQPQGATRMALPDEAAEPLMNVLNAYMAIGDQLASDAIEGTTEEAQKIGPALNILVKVEIPDNPHIWHMRADDIRAIRAQALTLAEAQDLNAARAAYGILSDALERVVSATGVPGGYEKPVNLFLCGTVDDAPRKGVWLQLGDATRNPYLGKQMLSCGTKQAPLPGTSGDTPPESNHQHQPKQRGSR